MEPALTEQTARADRPDVAPSPSASDSGGEQPGARPAGPSGDSVARPPWNLVRDTFLSVAASEAGPPLGAAATIMFMLFVIVRSRWVGIRFRWDEAAATRRRRAAARDKTAGRSSRTHPGDEMAPQPPPEGTPATSTFDGALLDSHDPGTVPTGGAALPGRDAAIEPCDLAQPAVGSLPDEPQPTPSPGDPRLAEPRTAESPQASLQPEAPHPAKSPPADPEVSGTQAVERPPAPPEPRVSRLPESQFAEPEPTRPGSSEPVQEIVDAGEPESIPDYARDPFWGDPIFGVPARRRAPPDEATD